MHQPLPPSPTRHRESARNPNHELPNFPPKEGGNRLGRSWPLKPRTPAHASGTSRNARPTRTRSPRTGIGRSFAGGASEVSRHFRGGRTKLIDHGHGSDQVGAGEEATSAARDGGTGPERGARPYPASSAFPAPAKGGKRVWRPSGGRGP